jgi:hypothetical protein
MLSWPRATQLSYSPTQTGGRKIVDDDDISIYMPEELERLEFESSFTLVFMM